LPGKRYRLREVEDVADEMVEMQRTRGIDIFVFHDDNFFVPGHKKNAARFSALADAIEQRGMDPFATLVKARPTDVDPNVFEILRRRLHCIRVYIGIETDADQGLQTLRRWSQPKQNKRAIEVARSLDLYTCFNLLYPGTPLLARMQAEGRTSGDYLQWDYRLASPELERVFDLTMGCFHARNFGPDSGSSRQLPSPWPVPSKLPKPHRDTAWSTQCRNPRATATSQMPARRAPLHPQLLASESDDSKRGGLVTPRKQASSLPVPSHKTPRIKPVKPPETGYGVVDPIPEPARSPRKDR